MIEKQKLTRKIVINDISYITLVAAYEMLGNSQTKIDKFLKFLLKKNSPIKKYFFLNGKESAVLFEKVLKDEKIDFSFKHRFLADWGFLRMSDPIRYKGLSKILKRISKTSWDEVHFFGMFHLKREFINGGPGRMFAYRLQASEQASIVEGRLVSKYFYCHLSNHFLEKDLLNGNIKYPRKALSYPYYHPRNKINGHIYMEEDEFLRLCATLKYHDIKLIEKPDYIYKDEKQIFPEPSLAEDIKLSENLTLEKSMRLNFIFRELSLKLINHIKKINPLPEDDEILKLNKKMSITGLGTYLAENYNKTGDGLGTRNIHDIFSDINKIKNY